jgi:hypothetical protein
MKKNLLTLSLTLLSGLVLLVGCSKDDTTAPVITLLGSDPMTISLNAGSVSDPGATAEDDEDGTVSVTSDWTSTNPNVNLTGTYIVTYTASDAAGNTATEKRTVVVKNDADYLAGTYTTTEGGGTPWTQSITASTTINNRIIFSYFANYLNNNQIYAQVTGSAVELPSSQTAVGIGSSGCTHIFTPGGSGSTITQVGGKYTFSIKFTDEQQAGGTGCTATSAVPYEDVFLQQ